MYKCWMGFDGVFTSAERESDMHLSDDVMGDVDDVVCTLKFVPYAYYNTHIDYYLQVIKSGGEDPDDDVTRGTPFLTSILH